MTQEPSSDYTGWLPTPEAINALPDPVRQYVTDLATQCDPAGIVAENTIARDTIQSLLRQVESLLTDKLELTEMVAGLTNQFGSFTDERGESRVSDMGLSDLEAAFAYFGIGDTSQVTSELFWKVVGDKLEQLRAAKLT